MIQVYVILIVKAKSRKLKENPLPNLDVRFPTGGLNFTNKNRLFGKKTHEGLKIRQTTSLYTLGTMTCRTFSAQCGSAAPHSAGVVEP